MSAIMDPIQRPQSRILSALETSGAIRRDTGWVPGHPGIWAFLITDLCAFSLYFFTFCWARSVHPDMFAAGTDALSTTTGTVNTFMLLTSSLFIALAVQRARFGNAAAAQRMVWLGVAGGVGFVISKSFEWGGKLSEGLGPHADVFFQMYFVTTGLHMLHVLVGLTFLGFMLKAIRAIDGPPSVRQTQVIESGAIFWHLVDLIWFVIFALFYLAG